jgi:hypothetical protein
MAGAFAKAWGNDEFTALEPRELMEYVALHHDEGWDIVDAAIGRDPKTGLPYNLVATPIPEIIKSGARGPALNEAHHPYCGLVSSMHTYGLYTGRYGMSDKVFVDIVPPEHKPAVEDLLATERGRQERLKAKLAHDPVYAPWVEETALFHNYKLLQFFDTLSLYFNCTPDAARGRSVFPNVPRAVGDDVSVTVERVSEGVYSLSPYPFRDRGLQIECVGRALAPQPEGTNMPAALAAAPLTKEIVTLEAAA